MNYSDSCYYFDIPNDRSLHNSFEGRLACVKDFLKKCAILPLALVRKSYRTILRVLGVCLSVGLIVITLGSSFAAREFFVERMSRLAKDLADWMLLPFAIVSCCVRLVMALSFHPNFYFNSIF